VELVGELLLDDPEPELEEVIAGRATGQHLEVGLEATAAGGELALGDAVRSTVPHLYRASFRIYSMAGHQRIGTREPSELQ